MKSILSYDSKFMAILEHVADTMILNVLFLLCCVPVVTIGAALTALNSASRARMSDEPCYRAFFRGLRSGFVRSTLAWLILCPVLVFLVQVSYTIFAMKAAGYIPTFLCSLLGLVVVLAITTMVFQFYSRFECKLFQLLKNSVFMVIAHPLRSAVAGVLTWVPVVLFFLATEYFIELTVVWVFLYFSTVSLVSVWLMKKPFASLEKRVSEDGKEQPAEQGEAAK